MDVANHLWLICAACRHTSADTAPCVPLERSGDASLHADSSFHTSACRLYCFWQYWQACTHAVQSAHASIVRAGDSSGARRGARSSYRDDQTSRWHCRRSAYGARNGSSVYSSTSRTCMSLTISRSARSVVWMCTAKSRITHYSLPRETTVCAWSTDRSYQAQNCHTQHAVRHRTFFLTITDISVSRTDETGSTILLTPRTVYVWSIRLSPRTCTLSHNPALTCMPALRILHTGNTLHAYLYARITPRARFAPHARGVLSYPSDTICARTTALASQYVWSVDNEFTHVASRSLPASITAYRPTRVRLRHGNTTASSCAQRAGRTWIPHAGASLVSYPVQK